MTFSVHEAIVMGKTHAFATRSFNNLQEKAYLTGRPSRDEMAINRACLDKSYGPITTKIDASSIEAYADATLDPLAIYRSNEPVAPPLFGIVPIWPAVQAALADEELGIDVGRVVHGEHRMTFHRLIRAGDELRSVGRITSISVRGPNEIFVLSFETHDADGSLVTAQHVVCVSRGTAKATVQLPPW